MEKQIKILIISTNALGDAYLSCSAISPLKNHFKKVRIDFVANENCEFFLKYARLDNIFYINKKSIKSIFRHIFLLSGIKYDYVFSFFPGLVNTFLYFISNSVFKSGFINFHKLEEWYNIPQNLYINYLKNGKYIWKPGMNFLGRIKLALNAAGINAENIKKYKFTLQPENFVIDNSILFCFSSRKQNKCLPLDLVENIIIYFCENENLNVNVIDTNNALINMYKHRNLHVHGSLSLIELVELMLKCKIFIGVDSFPLHIADAYGIDIIGLFAHTDPASVLQSETNEYHIIRKNFINDLSLQDIINKYKNIKS